MTKKETTEVTREAARLLRRNMSARRIVEEQLAIHGTTRHPLVDALLDIHNVLRNDDG